MSNIHSSLRSLNFWRVIMINLLVSVFVYMLMPLWPSVMVNTDHMQMTESGWTMMIFCLGLFVPGCVSSYLLDRYPRKRVCFWTIAVLVAVSTLSTLELPVWFLLLCRFVQGAAFALFHISLGSTILIDITVSERRDYAAYIYFWVCRFALAVGPALGIIALSPEWWGQLKYLPAVCAAMAVYFILRIELPFRTPLRSNIFSLDRFWLRHSVPLIITLFPISLVLGMEMAINLNPLFYCYLLGGFVASLILHFAVFYRADVRAEIVTGLFALAASFILLVTQDEEQMVVVAAVLSGYGVGNVTGRVLSFITATSKHTERGSAQVTYKLVFESALCIGFFLPCVCQGLSKSDFYLFSLALMVFDVLFYQLYVHKWFLRNVKR